ncbi:MAG: RICIN domain-containing protein [Clostridia bacterium]|nr:RICIN domain-containing protein [Clostridia bacterium]
MKKRIPALCLALILTLLCMPLSVPVSAEESSDSAAAGLYDEADDFARYGAGEEYAIVPCCAGNSAIDLDSDGATRLQLWKAHRGDNQRWIIGKSGDYYYFKSKMNGKVFDVPSADVSDGKAVQCYNYHGGDNQLWRLENLGDGTYSIHAKLNDSKVLDIAGGIWNDGASVQLYTQNRTPAQRFRFVHVSTTEPMSEWGASRHDCTGSNWSIWDGSCSYDWYYDHSGENDLYINTAADLFGLASFVVNGFEMEGKTIHLTRDVNLAGIEWTPIGFKGHWFRGSFNGHNHAIIGLSRTTDDDYNALFGMVAGGTICNLAVKGTVKGNEHVGGIVGMLQYGHLCNIYSEVTIGNCTYQRQGGVIGAIAYGGFVDHCTQNASVNSSDHDDCRGGIAGYSDGFIRYSVNNGTVKHNWNYAGGIAGTSGGVIEYCANHGTVGGSYYSDHVGGIAGWVKGGVILGCYNDGQIYSVSYRYVGGICGKLDVSDHIIGCINAGRVYGYEHIGGICGEGHVVKCLNIGIVTGDYTVGGVSGNSKWALSSYALEWSAATITGTGESNGGSWTSSSDLLSGKTCYQLNHGADTYDIYGITEIFSQNIGSDPYPTFGSSPVTESGGSYTNGEYRVTAECERGYGSVEGAGTYQSGDAVTLTAKPAAGCVFDHFEVKTAGAGKMTGWNGSQQDCPAVTVKTYTEETLILTNSIDKSYTVRAVFKVFDDTPEDMKVSVKLELECTNGVDGWNSDIIAAELVDSAGEKHRWDIQSTSLDGEGEKVSHDFHLGTTSPVAVYVFADFGGGVTFRDYGLKARMWVNGSGKAIESAEATLNSYPFTSSTYSDNYLHISFENFGNSVVGETSYTTCSEAWDKAKSEPSLTLRLESAWLLDKALEVGSGQTVNLDLNGYPVIRTIKKTDYNGELFLIREGGTLNISDSTPTRPSSGLFTGGSIQGGRSWDTAGLIECKGTLVMNGGTLYNGGTNDVGGAIKLTGNASASLTGVLISDCWSDKARTYQNEGGAIYMSGSAAAELKDCAMCNCHAGDYGGAVYIEDEGNRLTCENVTILNCKADDNYGGGVYQDEGETNWIGGRIANCSAGEYGGGFYQRYGKVYMQNVSFEENSTTYDGGAFYLDAGEGLWLIGCSMYRNKADNYGGAIYNNGNKMYLENSSVCANASGAAGGGIYLESPGKIDVAGTVVIRGGDGAGTMDNLVIENGATLYNQGLTPGSEIRLRSYSDGSVKLGGSLMSEYQRREYFRADYGRLELTDTQTVNTELRASVFSEGKTVLILTPVLTLAAIAVWCICKRPKRKGDEQ